MPGDVGREQGRCGPCSMGGELNPRRWEKQGPLLLPAPARMGVGETVCRDSRLLGCVHVLWLL